MIENPSFDSQTKEALTLKAPKFGSEPKLSEKFLKQILKSPIVENVTNFLKAREMNALSKKMGGGKKTKKLMGIDKLEDANDAGTAKSSDCTLILTEGDSAKSLAMSGIQVVGRDKYGVFPLKGKLLNVRDASVNILKNNKEIQDIVKILGLKMDTKYKGTESLRYGSIMIMADQDHDGSHIKGLVINFIHHFWPSLLKVKSFMKEFITPIIKARKGNDVKSFFYQIVSKSIGRHLTLYIYIL